MDMGLILAEDEDRREAASLVVVVFADVFTQC